MSAAAPWSNAMTAIESSLPYQTTAFAGLTARMMVELIDDFFAEYPATAGSDKVDTDEADEVIDAIAKVKGPRSCRQQQNIRLGSAAANPLSRSRNQQADGDG
jgi:hypothetical protein